MNTKTNTTTATAIELPKAPALRVCPCGCKEHVAGSATYRPGHDARHAGQVAKAIAAKPADAVALLESLPTRALQVKARDHAVRLIAKTEAKASKPEVKPATKKATPNKATK